MEFILPLKIPMVDDRNQFSNGSSVVYVYKKKGCKKQIKISHNNSLRVLKIIISTLSFIQLFAPV